MTRHDTPFVTRGELIIGVLASWKQKILQRPRQAPDANALSQFTIGQLIGGLRPAQLWSVLGAITALVAGAFAVGAKLFAGQ